MADDDPILRTAILLAAGSGSRLRDVVGERPKCLLRIDGRSLLERSLGKLRRRGVDRLVVVAGYRADLLEPAVHRLWPDAEIVRSPEFATTGSMRSLALAAPTCPEGALVVESDLLYPERALRLLQRADAPDALLVSEPTGAGDEVHVCGTEGVVREISKRPGGRWPVVGELVGISRLSGETLAAAARSHDSAGASAAGEHYEERLSRLAASGGIRIEWCLARHLPWSEIDHRGHLERVVGEVLPALRAEDPA